MKKKGQKGSVTLFVLVACLFFITFLIGMSMLVSVERQAQIEATKQTQNIYSQGNANEIYSNYFDESMTVPIYTKAQLDKMCSGEQVAINEEGGKIYTFGVNSTYLLKEDITFEHEGIWEIPTFGETGRIEGNGKKIKIKDTSKAEEYYYYYKDLNRYKEPLTEEGYLLSWDKNKVSTTKVEESTITGVKDIRIVPIPEGFVMSSLPGENTVSGGLVIYEGTNGVTDADEDSNEIIDAQENRNQFVWIPVDDINSMVMCKNNNLNGTGTKCNLELREDSEGKYNLICKVHNSTELCGRLYATKTNISTTPYTTNMNFTDRTQTWSDTGYREPDKVSIYDTDETTGGLATFTTQMTDDFVNMATSVAKYRGFYVSRYEAGENGASKKNQVVITAASSDSTVRKGLSNWYGLYNTVKSSTAVGKTAVSTHMIYGSQYDQIINFIGVEAQTGHSDRQLATQQRTGYADDKDIMKNIYDLEGNNCEFTAQAYDANVRVYRGGNYGAANVGNSYPASSRTYDYYPTTSFSNGATRLSLYL